MTPHGSPETEHWLQAQAKVRAHGGLHARPAIRVARLARGFMAMVRMRIDGSEHRWIDAKSVAKVMGLRVEPGRTVLLKASGPDAAAALQALADLIGSDFSDAGGSPA